MYTLRTLKHSDSSHQHNQILGDSYLLLTETEKTKELFNELKANNAGYFSTIGDQHVKGIIKTEKTDIPLLSGYTYYIMLDGKTLDTKIFPETDKFVSPQTLKNVICSDIKKPIDFWPSHAKCIPNKPKGTTLKVKEYGIVNNIEMLEGDILLYEKDGNNPVIIQKQVDEKSVANWNDAKMVTPKTLGLNISKSEDTEDRNKQCVIQANLNESPVKLPKNYTQCMDITGTGPFISPDTERNISISDDSKMNHVYKTTNTLPYVVGNVTHDFPVYRLHNSREYYIIFEHFLALVNSHTVTELPKLHQFDNQKMGADLHINFANLWDVYELLKNSNVFKTPNIKIYNHIIEILSQPDDEKKVVRISELRHKIMQKTVVYTDGSEFYITLENFKKMSFIPENDIKSIKTVKFKILTDFEYVNLKDVRDILFGLITSMETETGEKLDLCNNLRKIIRDFRIIIDYYKGGIYHVPHNIKEVSSSQYTYLNDKDEQQRFTLFRDTKVYGNPFYIIKHDAEKSGYLDVKKSPTFTFDNYTKHQFIEAEKFLSYLPIDKSIYHALKNAIKNHR